MKPRDSTLQHLQDTRSTCQELLEDIVTTVNHTGFSKPVRVFVEINDSSMNSCDASIKQSENQNGKIILFKSMKALLYLQFMFIFNKLSF